MKRHGLAGKIAAAMLGMALAVPAAALPEKKPPFFGSITPARARMRAGPGRAYPATWIYRRPDLPVRVIDVFHEKSGASWRKVEDPQGTQGWMQANLVSERRTAMVMGGVLEMRDQPGFGGRVQWRAAPGVIGRINRCQRGWCWLDVHGRGGFVEVSHLWGVSPDETIG